MLPEMSHSATKSGHRSVRLRMAKPWISPPWRSARRIVAGQSGRRPAGAARIRRLTIGRTGRLRRAMAARASRISAPDICSKSSVRRRSSPLAVAEASI